jgi:AraC family transcriptional regulator
LKSEHTNRYCARLIAVLEHIDAHLDADLRTDGLGAIAAFSKFHFHRQFQALFGINVQHYVQLSRLRRASYRLAFRNHSVLDVALASGYESPESFARAFRKLLAQTPSAFRAGPDWDSWAKSFHSFGQSRHRHMDTRLAPDQIRIVEFPLTKIALLEHRGDPLTIGSSIRKFIEWRKRYRLHPSVSATFNILYDDPEAVPVEQFRFGLAAATSITITPNEHGIVDGAIPAGRCAKATVIGSDTVVAASVRELYSSWLPASGEEPREFPLFVQRVTFYPDVPEHEAITDVYLPLK